MELTREEAIRNFREHWGSLAITGTDDKKEYLKRNGFPEIQDSCFLCEFTKRTCSKCPVEWPNMKTISLACVSSIYGEWGRAAAPEERSRLAALIRDLPIKEYEKPAPKFAVGDKVVPVSKSMGCNWAKWEEDNDFVHKHFKTHGFLYVSRIRNDRIELSATPQDMGDHFLESDLIPYVEPKPEVTHKFKVGDIVVGNAEGDRMYSVTTSRMTRGKVTELCGNDKIQVKVLKHKDGYSVGTVFDVSERCFDLVVDEPKEVKPEPAKEEPKPVFKVGDRVRVKKDLIVGHEYGDLHLHAGQMADERGREGIVNSVRSHSLSISGSWFSWDFGMIELIPIPSNNQAPENKTETLLSITFTFKGSQTICRIEENGRKFKGSAKCNPGDEWNEQIGNGKG